MLFLIILSFFFGENTMTQEKLILLPMLGMIFLTFGVMTWMLKLRYRAIREDGMNPAYFSLYRGAKIPDYLAKVTQHYANLLEMPILFYAAILLLTSLNISDTLYVFLSWAFLILRLIHSYIHTTYNKVAHRKNVFIASVFILIFLWLRITVSVITQ